MASALLQEESLLLYVTREILLQQMAKTMLISLKSDSRSLERRKQLQLSMINSLSIMAVFADLI